VTPNGNSTRGETTIGTAAIGVGLSVGVGVPLGVGVIVGVGVTSVQIFSGMALARASAARSRSAWFLCGASAVFLVVHIAAMLMVL